MPLLSRRDAFFPMGTILAARPGDPPDVFGTGVPLVGRGILGFDTAGGLSSPRTNFSGNTFFAPGSWLRHSFEVIFSTSARCAVGLVP